MADEPRDERRIALGKLVERARMRRFESVTAALQASGVNRATWLRVENGDKVRDDRLIAAEKALDWPPGIMLDYLRGFTVRIDLNNDGSVASEIIEPATQITTTEQPVDLDDLVAKIEEMARRLERLERRKDDDDGEAGGGSVTPIRPPDAPSIPDDVAAADPGKPSEGELRRDEHDAGYDINQDRNP